MPDYLAAFQSGVLTKVNNLYIAKQLASLNERTKEYGIILSKEDCTDIAECRSELLVENERIEIGVGAVKRIIEDYCDSGYVNQQNFRDTVEGLLECFYTIKTETEDKVDDETVLAFLKELFENEAGGDVSRIYYCDAFEDFIKNGRKAERRRKSNEDDEY